MLTKFTTLYIANHPDKTLARLARPDEKSRDLDPNAGRSGRSTAVRVDLRRSGLEYGKGIDRNEAMPGATKPLNFAPYLFGLLRIAAPDLTRKSTNVSSDFTVGHEYSGSAIDVP